MSGNRTHKKGTKMNMALVRNSVGVIILCLSTSCSTVSDKVGSVVLDRLSKDTARTVELAEKYQAPEIARCAKFLQMATTGVKELADEPTAGIFSSAFKATMLRRMGTAFEDAFAAECGGVAARMLVELGRRAPIPGIN